jgi:hypothetical protein
MRILFVAMPDSLHTARWISQIADQGWEIYLFPAYIGPIRPEIKNATIFGSLPRGKNSMNSRIKFVWWTILPFWLDYLVTKISRIPSSAFARKSLAIIIRRIRPDIIHSLEIQHAGYLTLAAKEKLSDTFPAWIVTNWGSDIYLFGRLPTHKPKIQAILSGCDYYSCECQRDIELAKQLGFQGEILPVLPNTGGFSLPELIPLKNNATPASRRTILLKGYQNFAGRALVGLQALRLCADLLEGYTIAIFSANDDVRVAAELFQQDTKIPVEIIAAVSHDTLLGIHAKSRIYIGLSISDAISTSLLEAMVMGAFPIQSCTACADEWIEEGVSGFIVPPEDPHVIAQAIRRAIEEDDLVNHAAEINAQTAVERLDCAIIQPQVVNSYQKIIETLRDRK